MKFSPCRPDKTVSELQIPCLHYVLQLVDEVTCSCCHVEGLQSVGHMLVERGEQRTALAFTHLFLCLLRDAYCSNNLLSCVAIGASSVLHLDWKKWSEKRKEEMKTEQERE